MTNRLTPDADWYTRADDTAASMVATLKDGDGVAVDLTAGGTATVLFKAYGPGTDISEACTLDDAAKAIIGISYSHLGILIADKWNLPKMITDSMKPVSNYNIKKEELSPESFLQFINAFANDICDIDLEDDRQAAEKKLKKCSGIVVYKKKLFDIELRERYQIGLHLKNVEEITHE